MAWNYPAPAPLAPFGCWPYTMAIPEFYCDAESPEQRVKYLCMLYDKLMAYVDTINDSVNIDSQAIAELQEAFSKFMNSGFDDYFYEQMQKWLCTNMADWLACSARFFWFWLDDEGNIMVSIPENWQFLTFSFTNTDQNSEDYGRLILLWDETRVNTTCPYTPCSNE